MEKSASKTKDCGKKLRSMFAAARRSQKERERKAGAHECVKICTGSVRRVTGKSGKILKRPVVTTRFYECKVCGRDMGT